MAIQAHGSFQQTGLPLFAWTVALQGKENEQEKIFPRVPRRINVNPISFTSIELGLRSLRVKNTCNCTSQFSMPQIKAYKPNNLHPGPTVARRGCPHYPGDCANHLGMVVPDYGRQFIRRFVAPSQRCLTMVAMATGMGALC